MAEQPSQLKFIEWPSFTTTVRCVVSATSTNSFVCLMFLHTYFTSFFFFYVLMGEQLKTATLSLFLVAVFIVALSSVDSALCYVLALILRKSL